MQLGREHVQARDPVVASHRHPAGRLSSSSPAGWSCSSLGTRAISYSRVLESRRTRLAARVSQQSGHRYVFGRDQRGEPADALLAGTIRQPGQQFAAQTPALPVIGDRDGDVGGVRVIGVPDEPGDAHPTPVAVIQGAERLVVVVVEVGEVAQLRW